MSWLLLLLLKEQNKTATAVCESDADALTDPKEILHSTETTDGVPQSEKTSLLSPNSKGATPTNAHPETEGT